MCYLVFLWRWNVPTGTPSFLPSSPLCLPVGLKCPMFLEWRIAERNLLTVQQLNANLPNKSNVDMWFTSEKWPKWQIRKSYKDRLIEQMFANESDAAQRLLLRFKVHMQTLVKVAFDLKSFAEALVWCNCWVIIKLHVFFLLKFKSPGI